MTSGVSVGVPGTPRPGTRPSTGGARLSLRRALKPAARLARRGFVVDPTFNLQTSENAARFRTFSPTIDLFLDDGVPEVGSVFRNPDLARTYTRLGKRGIDWLYDGALAAEIAATVQEPPLSGETDLPAPPGSMTTADLAGYDALVQKPTRVCYRGYDVYGMAPSSSGGTTVGESLNILEQFDLAAMPDGGRAAPLPRGDRARVRRPGGLRRRPGLRRRARRRPARRRLRRRAGLPDQPRLRGHEARPGGRRVVVRRRLRRRRPPRPPRPTPRGSRRPT